MKKIAIFALLLMSFSGYAYGAELTSGSTTPTAGLALYGGQDADAAADATNPMVRLSSGVFAMANYDENGYAIFTKHNKGTKIFGTPHDSTKMYWKQVAAETALDTSSCGSDSGDANFEEGWTSY